MIKRTIRNKDTKKVFMVIILTVTFTMASCIDTLNITTINDAGRKPALVVEAVLTNEFKKQQVSLSRSDSRLDLEKDTVYLPYISPGSRPRDTINVERGATVRIFDDRGTVYNLSENNGGVYRSDEAFALALDRSYQVEITTMDGNEYISDEVAVQGTADINNLYAERVVSDTGVEGIGIFVDSEPITGITENFRYDYTETYKVIAPLWVPEEFKLTNYQLCPETPYILEIVPREVENRVCYNTVASNAIELTTTAGSTTNNVNGFQVQFIGKGNFILTHRYSILVRQYVQSAESFSFFNRLKKFSSTGLIFSQIQPGQLQSNVFRKDGSAENVLGWIEAVSVSEQRLFFNFEDFFPDEERPAYPFNCNLFSSPERVLACNEFGTPIQLFIGCPPGIVEGVDQNIYSYYAPYDAELVPGSSCPGPYVYTPTICGDCRLLGDNIVPEFWTEE